MSNNEKCGQTVCLTFLNSRLFCWLFIILTLCYNFPKASLSPLLWDCKFCYFFNKVWVRVRCLVLGSTPQSAYIRVWKEVFHCSGNRLWYILYMFSLVVISRGSGYLPCKLLLTLLDRIFVSFHSEMGFINHTYKYIHISILLYIYLPFILWVLT